MPRRGAAEHQRDCRIEGRFGCRLLGGGDGGLLRRNFGAGSLALRLGEARIQRRDALLVVLLHLRDFLAQGFQVVGVRQRRRQRQHDGGADDGSTHVDSPKQMTSGIPEGCRPAFDSEND